MLFLLVPLHVKCIFKKPVHHFFRILLINTKYQTQSSRCKPKILVNLQKEKIQAMAGMNAAAMKIL
jgi:hypothetical protein